MPANRFELSSIPWSTFSVLSLPLCLEYLNSHELLSICRLCRLLFKATVSALWAWYVLPTVFFYVFYVRVILANKMMMMMSIVTAHIISFQPSVTSRFSAIFTEPWLRGSREPTRLQLRQLVMDHEISTLPHFAQVDIATLDIVGPIVDHLPSQRRLCPSIKSWLHIFSSPAISSPPTL